MMAEKEVDKSRVAVTIISSDLKVGTVTAIGGYLHKFDKESPASIFSTAGAYSSNTDFSFLGVLGHSEVAQFLTVNVHIKKEQSTRTLMFFWSSNYFTKLLEKFL